MRPVWSGSSCVSRGKERRWFLLQAIGRGPEGLCASGEEKRQTGELSCPGHFLLYQGTLFGVVRPEPL